MVSRGQSIIGTCVFAAATGKLAVKLQMECFGTCIDTVTTILQGQGIDDIPSAVIEDAAQLVKANSINGNKMNNVDVVYTMWENLKKTPAMDVGQVSFHREKDVKKIRVEKRINDIVNRLNKTKTEEHPGK